MSMSSTTQKITSPKYEHLCAEWNTRIPGGQPGHGHLSLYSPLITMSITNIFKITRLYMMSNLYSTLADRFWLTWCLTYIYGNGTRYYSCRQFVYDTHLFIAHIFNSLLKPTGNFQSKECNKLASVNSTFILALGIAGQILLPAPNGRNSKFASGGHEVRAVLPMVASRWRAGRSKPARRWVSLWSHTLANPQISFDNQVQPIFVHEFLICDGAPPSTHWRTAPLPK